MASVPEQVSRFLAKAEARDKSGRVIQYAARSVVGLCALVLQRRISRNRGSRTELDIHSIQLLQQKARNVLSMLSDARRTHRWGKEISVFRKVGKLVGQAVSSRTYVLENPSIMLDLLSKALLGVFLVRDHAAWLCKVKILDVEPKLVIRANLRWAVVSHALQLLFQLCRLRDVSRRLVAFQDGQAKALGGSLTGNNRGGPVPGTAWGDGTVGGVESSGSEERVGEESSAAGDPQEDKPSRRPSSEEAPRPDLGAALLYEEEISVLISERRVACESALRSLLLCMQGLHNSQWYELHDFPVGLMGVITSLYDCTRQWA